MDEPRVVITGVGILASNGEGREAFWNALKEGKVGYKPVTTFDPSQFRHNIAGEIREFDAKVYMGQKGLRLLDRSTRLAISAAKLCIQDSGFVIDDVNTEETGVSFGCTLGSIKSIAEFDLVTLREGPRYTNPALFPNTVINSPASQISIWHKIKGFNTTIASGFSASLDAMRYAYDFIQDEKYKTVFAGGVEEMNFYTFLGFHELKFMSGSREGQSFINCPFDKRRNGVTFGEGSGLVAMEDYNQAAGRGAKILAEVAGFGQSFDPFRLNRYNPKALGIKRALRFALEDAKLEPKDIDCIFANANSTINGDKIETEAIKDVFGEYAYKIPVTAVKSMVGECYSVSGVFAAIAAIGAINENFIPPTVNYLEPDPDCDLDYVPNKSRPAKLKNVLITTMDPSGNNACMILKRFEA